MAMEKAAIVALGSGSIPPYGRVFGLAGGAGLGGGDATNEMTSGLTLPTPTATMCLNRLRMSSTQRSYGEPFYGAPICTRQAEAAPTRNTRQDVVRHSCAHDTRGLGHEQHNDAVVSLSRHLHFHSSSWEDVTPAGASDACH